MAPLMKRFAPGRAATLLRTAAEDAACVANLDRRDVSASLVFLHENTKLLQRFAQVEPLPENKAIATAVVGCMDDFR